MEKMFAFGVIRGYLNLIPSGQSLGKNNCRLRRVSQLLTGEGTWDVGKLRRYFLQVDVDAILRIKLSSRGQEDLLAWEPTRTGIFSVKSAY
jgi:hypothetical protein